jgi:hypothetical protein
LQAVIAWASFDISFVITVAPQNALLMSNYLHGYEGENWREMKVHPHCASFLETRARACVRACVRTCVRARARVRVRVCPNMKDTP